MIHYSFGNTNECTILESMYSFYYYATTCFGIVATLRDLNTNI